MRLFAYFTFLLLISFIFTGFAFAKSVKISTWNLNWLIPEKNLQKYNLPDNIPHRTEKDWKKLQFYAQKLSSDIILLEEVDGIEAAEKLFPKSQYELYQTESDIPQKEVLAVRKTLAVKVRQHADLKSLAQNPESPYPLRSGLDATLTFPNQKTIRLLGVHLKSGCWERSEKEKKHSCPILYKQFRDLRYWISLREQEAQDFILLGDFNRRLSKADFVFKNLTAENSTPLILTSTEKASPCEGGEYFIDHIILRKSDKITFVPDSLRVQITEPKDIEYVLSDHCAVSAQISL